MATTTFDLYNLMERDNVLLAFKGTITSDLLDSVFQIMESKMVDLNDSPATKKKVFNVLVECLQNLYHHIDDFDKDNFLDVSGSKQSAIFSISRNEDAYNIVTGNFIYPKNVEEVSNKIDHINSLDRDELKAYYKEVLNNGKLSEKGGGGLGLIDIAKKSRNKLQYSFKEIDDDYSFFTLTVKILK